MKIVFFHVGDDISLPRIMVGSVRRHFPGVEILHLTDSDTPRIGGATRVEGPCERRRFPYWRLRHYATVTGDTLFLDTDTIVERPFELAFHPAVDYAAYVREKIYFPHKINSGVVFSRTPQLWADAADWLDGRNMETTLLGDQTALNYAAVRYRGQSIGRAFNYSPDSEGDDALRFISHYKGKDRKPWMLNRAEEFRYVEA